MSILYAQDWLSYASAEAERDEATGNLVIDFTIQENPMISSVTVEGEDKIGERPLLRAQGLAAKDFFSPGAINSNRDLVLDYYLSRGYRDATVDASYTEDSESNTVQIVYTVSEGKQYKVRNILFEGVSGLSAKEINSVLTQKKKSFFSSGNLVMSNIDTDKAANRYGQALTANENMSNFLEMFRKDKSTLVNLGIREEDIPLMIDLVL